MTIAPGIELDHKPKWTVRDYQLLAFTVLIKFGDSIEIYLPGVITQKVAYELNLSEIEEGFLGVTMYITMATAILIAAPLSDRYSNYQFSKNLMYNSWSIL